VMMYKFIRHDLKLHIKMVLQGSVDDAGRILKCG
jgi:hypothetical protein